MTTDEETVVIPIAGHPLYASDLAALYDANYQLSALSNGVVTTWSQPVNPALQWLLPRDLTPGTILDCGAGVGQHASYLADAGHDVTAYEISAVALEAHAQDPRIKSIRRDVREGVEGVYDLIVMLFLLHHLTPDEAKAFVSNAIEHTETGGCHLLQLYLYDESAVPEDHPGYSPSSPDELVSWYEAAGWALEDVNYLPPNETYADYGLYFAVMRAPSDQA